MTTPKILDEIRRVRHLMSAEINHDPNRIVDYFAAMEKRNASRIVNLADQGPKGRTKDCTEADGRPQSDGSPISSAR
jgi:hypothetical protein